MSAVQQHVQTYAEPNCKATHCLSMRVATHGCTLEGTSTMYSLGYGDVIENQHHVMPLGTALANSLWRLM